MFKYCINKNYAFPDANINVYRPSIWYVNVSIVTCFDLQFSTE
jgi:hypothetical protein